MRAILTLLLFACLAVPAAAQQAGTPDRWSAFEYFIGAWTGEESATFGDGRGERTYELVLQDRYLLGRNRSVFPSQDGLPDGDDHEDWTVVSYDNDRDTYVLRQFNSEGFVNTFVLDDASTPNGRRVGAILLLLSRLGLRAAEAVALTVKDVDWHNGIVRVAGLADSGESAGRGLRHRATTVSAARPGRASRPSPQGRCVEPASSPRGPVPTFSDIIPGSGLFRVDSVSTVGVLVVSTC